MLFCDKIHKDNKLLSYLPSVVCLLGEIEESWVTYTLATLPNFEGKDKDLIA